MYTPLLRRPAALASLCLASLSALATPTKSSTGFIENRGQIHTPAGAPVPAVRYLLSLPGLNVQLRGDGFSYDTWTRNGQRKGLNAHNPRKPFENAGVGNISCHFHRVDVAFVGALPGAMLQPTNTATDLLNYYGPATPDGLNGVRHFGTVTYREVWPHIDVEFLAAPGKAKPVEYNFILHPGARVSDIRLRYEGANESILKSGALHLKTAAGTLTENIPASYWASTEQPVDVHYAVLAEDADGITVGFAAALNTEVLQAELVIDPTPNISWATYYGGTDYDGAYGTAGDSLGNSYLTGGTASLNAIATTGAHQTTLSSGAFGAFLVKFNSAGVRQWATYYGSVDETGWDVAADATGTSIYLAGTAGATTGIATTGAHQITFGGGDYDGFLVRFNAAGVRQWGTYYGGASNDYCTGVELDAAGLPHVAGATESLNAIASAGAHQTAYGGGSGFGDPGDGFVAKFNAAGVRQWATYYGGSDDDFCFGIGVDATGAVYASGTALSAAGIATTGAHQSSFAGGSDAFMVKFSPAGVRQWGTYYGGTDEDYSWELAVRRSTGDLYVCGTTSSPAGIATTGAHQAGQGASGTFAYDAFLARFNSAGVRQWGTYYGGTDDDESRAVAIDSAGNVYLGGVTASANAISTPNAYKVTLGANDYDAFLAKFSAAGVRQWGTYFGGPEEEYMNFHALSVSGSVGTGFEGIHLSGETSSISGVATAGAHQTAFGGATGDADGFFTRFNNCTSTNTPPTVSIVASPAGPVCAEVPVTFTATPGVSVGIPAIRWSRNGTLVPGATSLTFTTSSLANGNVIRAVISIPGSCGDTLRDSSNAITMNILPLPVPTITAAGSVLSTQSFTSYQWMRNGTTIPGATSQSYTATQSGAYRVIVTGSNGCSDTSAVLNFTPTAVKDVTGVGAAIRIFPNPTVNTLNIESPVAVDAVVRSVDGREVMRVKSARSFSLETLPDGLYLVSLVEQSTGAVLRVEKVTKGKQ